MNTKEVRNKVRKCLRKSVYFGKNRVTGKRKAGDDKVATPTGKRKAGDDDDATLTGKRKASDDDDATLTGKRRAGDNDDAAVVGTSKFIPKDKDACIECNQPSNHSCRKCKKRICSLCCYERRKIAVAWWCDVCFKTQSPWKQHLIHNSTYTTLLDEE